MTINLHSVRLGVLLSLVSIVFGFALGGAFGVVEDSLKQGLKDRAAAVLDTVYKGDKDKASSVVDKSWSYYKRAHLHAGSIGTMALATAILLSLLTGVSQRLRSMTAGMLGAGALGYSVFWLVAGYIAPGMGSTGAAKEALRWLAVPTAGLCLVGAFLATGLACRALYLNKAKTV